MNIVFPGFSGQGTFDGSRVSLISFDVQTSANLIESNGAYGGEVDGDSNVAVGAPFLIDVPDISGTIGFEPTFAQVILLSNWIYDRNSSKSVGFSVGSDSKTSLTYNECFFESIGLRCSQNDLLNVDINMWMYQTKWCNGSLSGSTAKQGLTPIFTNTVRPIAFWETKIEGLPTGEVLSWNLTINQQLTRKYYCDGSEFDEENNEPPLPKDVFVGPLNVELSVDILIAETDIPYSSILKKGGNNDTISVYVRNQKMFSCSRYVMTSLNPTLSDSVGANSVSLVYKAYKQETLN